MKHGVAFRKFSRTTSHRMLMLRNLVTSLIKHEQIKTTLPKARDTARLVEKIITMGKKGTHSQYQRANAFMLEPKLVPKVFEELAVRYAERPGGYTRIHKFGNRPGDNAPHAILELVDNPRDIKFEMTARTIGWELLSKQVGKFTPEQLAQSGVKGLQKALRSEQKVEPGEQGLFKEKTRWNLQKVMKYRSPEALAKLQSRAEDHIDTLLAEPVALKEMMAHQQKEKQKQKNKDQEAEDGEDPETSLSGRKALRLKAGQILPGSGISAMRMARGALDRGEIRAKWFGRTKLGIDMTSIWDS